MKPLPLSFLACLLAMTTAARADAADAGVTPLPLDAALEISTVPLWTDAVPGAKGAGPEDTPTLTVFAPPAYPGARNGTAVIVVPGGAYFIRAANHEGRAVADWFTDRGITAFVLKYRLNQKYLYPVPLQDAQRAVRWVRAHAKEYSVAPDRIGMCGFSAGGHLSAMTGTSFDDGDQTAADPVEKMSSRPDFLVLGYAWLDAMQPPKPKMIPSYQTLMHVPQSEWADFAAKYTPTLHVTEKTPPAFLWHTTDDGTVAVDASLDFYRALIAKGVSAELHVFAHGGHGVGLGRSDPALSHWPTLLDAWLRGRGLLNIDPAVQAALEAKQAAERKK